MLLIDKNKLNLKSMKKTGQQQQLRQKQKGKSKTSTGIIRSRWELNNGSNIFSCRCNSPISAIAISKNKKILAIGDFNGGVYAIAIV
jgi:hypothetical protein